MALETTPSGAPLPVLRIVTGRELARPTTGWSGLLGVCWALGRREAVQRAAGLLPYGLLACLIGLLLLVAAATVPVLFDYHIYIVEGGSMEPSLRAGSVAVTHPTSTRALQVGDVIVWRASPQSPPVLQRIVEVTDANGERLFVTKGDENRSPDRELLALQGPGDRVVYSVPYVGYILKFAESGAGRFLLIGAPLALLAALILRERRQSPRVENEREVKILALERKAPPAPAIVIPVNPGTREQLPVFILRQLRRRPPHSTPAPAPIVLRPLLAEQGAGFRVSQGCERRAA